MARLHPALLSLWVAATASAPTGPFGGLGTTAVPLAERAILVGRHTGPPSAPSALSFPTYRWPVERALGDRLWIVNYADHDATSGRRDYEGGAWNYDGHTGTDIALPDFREMDRGVRVLAAAAGTVSLVGGPTPYDRHCTFDWPDDGNWVSIGAGDGSWHNYLHLRRDSRTVQLGDAVAPGQLLGLIGSSGYSTVPHVHFEAGDLSGPADTYQFRDPFHGSANPLPTLWQSQPDYVADDRTSVMDQGVFTESETGGSVFNTQYCDILDPLLQPLTYGRDEQRVCMWVHFAGHAGDSLRVVLRRPSGAEYGAFTSTLTQDEPLGWFWSWFFFQPYVTPADDGVWHFETWRDGTLLRDDPFVVAASTTWGPRFWPRAGRSFRIDGTVQRDTLRRHPFSPAVSYALLGAPSAVALMSDSVVVIGATSNQPTRSAWFRVVMQDAQARTDTAIYHLVDFSKPPDAVTGVGSGVEPARLSLAASPQPSAGHVAIRFTLPEPGPARVEVFDSAGRRVRTLLAGRLASGAHTLAWDGRDDHGARTPPGLYHARLTIRDAAISRRIVRL